MKRILTISYNRGRGLSYQLVNATEGGPAYTWSSIASTPLFDDGSVPMPIIVALERAPLEQNLSKDTQSVVCFANPVVRCADSLFLTQH